MLDGAGTAGGTGEDKPADSYRDTPATKCVAAASRAAAPGQKLHLQQQRLATARIRSMQRRRVSTVRGPAGMASVNAGIAPPIAAGKAVGVGKLVTNQFSVWLCRSVNIVTG